MTSARPHSRLLVTQLLALLCLVTLALPALVLQTHVQIPLPNGEQAHHRLELRSDDEPVDVLEDIRAQYHQTRRWRQSILSQVCQQPRVQCRRDRPVTFRSSIGSSDGRVVGMLEVLEDQEPVDALARFAQHHGLARHERDHVLDAMCQQPALQCSRFRSLIFQQNILTDHGQPVGRLEVFDDTEPVDQIYRFLVDHEAPMAVLPQLVGGVCANVRCERREPFVFSRRIVNPDGQIVGRLDIPIDREPADVVYMFGLHYRLDKAFRLQLLQTVCTDKYVKCKRMAPYVFASPIVLEDGSNAGVLRIEEDQELADAVYHFAKEANLTTQDRISLLQTLCGRTGIRCTRGQALLRSQSIGGPGNTMLGVINVFEGQEPADVVYAFAEQHGLPAHEASHLVDVVCGISREHPLQEGEEPLTCNRFSPVIFAVPVSAQNGSRLGVLEVLVGDEPADAVARFGNKHGLGDDEKANLLSGICSASGLPCNRKQGLIYQAVYTLPDGVRERLDFWDGQEPTDVIYDYGLMRNLTLRDRKRFLLKVCNEPRRRPNCTRAEPMLIKIPVWESADKKMGDLEVLEGQEPIDQVYAFMEKHDLFQTAPLNTSLLEVVCNSTRVTCARQRPRRILFSMTATYGGVSHTLQYVQPESDWICEAHPHGGQRCVHYVEVLSRDFCETHMEDWAGCEARILEALRSQLEAYEERMWRGKDLYAKLGLVKDASKEEIDMAYNRLVKRFNNETEPYKYEKLQEAYRTLSDPEEKYYYDLPCMKFFGLCGKRKKDGSISITTDS
ncbi:hypothetical protein P43SY_009367 [Pythium insidiosum]|uniref:J domain-containing protein n=1 Tax=Pythium insidiosum TaxID=114742 RepID=A0AAD5LHW4_PYTIN|nr:hypothetical protein P43SY_009367 [Pythium insidiosum]